ncbi:methionine synthase [Saccharicrinis sp. FJH62]|uniref:methionine synthase n=1 Tax=Saccharicrinis sp. FJH62 TaxID=3344657 RepID=UPI0035D4A63C
MIQKPDINNTAKNRVLILDGAMGSTIQRYKLQEDDFRGERFKDHPSPVQGNNDLLCITRPDIISEIHRNYLLAGADILSTNTFNANAISLADYNMSDLAYEMNREAARLAREEADKMTSETPDQPRYVAGSIGPTNKTASMSPDVNNPAYRAVSFDDLVRIYKEQALGLIDGGAELILIETIFDTLNAKAAIFAVEQAEKERSVKLPLMISVTITDLSGRTLSGQTVKAFWISVSHAKPFSVGVNCSFGAKALKPYIEELGDMAPCLISAHPNAGLPNQLGDYDQTPRIMAELVQEYFDDELVNIIGGCCGTRPEHIAELAKRAKNATPRIPSVEDSLMRLSGLEPLEIRPDSNFVNIGERCNVAGSKKFVRLIKNKLYDEALEVARDQVEGGAQILDINMDDALLEAKEEMVQFLNLLMSEPDISKLPVMVDSSKWPVIEAGLKCLQGKSIVNSISLKEGEEQFINQASLIKSYGAAVVVMAFDEKGQADSFERRKEICTRAYNLLVDKIGFQPQDIIFDPNVLAIATGIEEHNNYVLDFIKTVKWIKANLPHAKISGGISNLSFSFRGNNVVREAIHSVFLYYAIKEGLDMGIVNPSMLQVYDEIPKDLLVLVEDVVLNRRPDATERLIEAAEQIKNNDSGEGPAKAKDEWRNGTLEERLSHCLVKGIDSYLDVDINEALEKYPAALDIIEQPLMAGMNVVGDLFGDGKMFLPQVVKTARVMKKAVAILQPYIEMDKKGGSHSAGKILMATVKGDVHDIGKNIVNVILACNNFEVVDLGVMVPAEKILDTAIEENVDAIGLSGLITPSLEEMAKIAEEMKKRGMTLPLMVGGATTSKVHTAVKIAPKYSHIAVHVKDASQSVQVAAAIINPKTKDEFKSKLDVEYGLLRDKFSKGNTTSFEPIESARRKGVKLEFNENTIYKPEFLGVKEPGELDTSKLRAFIDWTFFFKAWRLPGSYKGIRLFEDEKSETAWLNTFKEGLERVKAKEALTLYREANAMLDDVLGNKKVRAKAVLGFFPVNSEKDDIIFWKDESRNEVLLRFPFLRQQATKDAGIYNCLSDYIAPVTHPTCDYIGAFAVTAGLDIEPWIEKYEKENDDYSALLLKSLSDRLAEAYAELLHMEVRRDYWGFAKDEDLSIKDMLRVKYQGIRPAIGYPSMPNQADNFLLDKLIPLEKAEIQLTENGAMYPNASVSCLVFAHPDSAYFAITKIDDDQASDYANRLGIAHEEIEKWLYGMV